MVIASREAGGRVLLAEALHEAGGGALLPEALRVEGAGAPPPETGMACLRTPSRSQNGLSQSGYGKPYDAQTSSRTKKLCKRRMRITCPGSAVLGQRTTICVYRLVLGHLSVCHLSVGHLSLGHLSSRLRSPVLGSPVLWLPVLG